VARVSLRIGKVELRVLASRPKEWEQETLPLVGGTFFHSSPWLDYVGAAFSSHPVRYVRVTSGAELVGYLCALRATRLVFETWSSPVPGAGMYLGPVLRSDEDQAEFMTAIDNYCDTNGIARLTVCNERLRSEVMSALGFRARRGETFETPLVGGEQGAWRRMRGPCRTRIRKARKRGLRAEVTSDPGIVDEFYELFLRTMNRKGMVPEYDIERPRALFRHLMPAQKLFAVRVRHRGRVIAVGLYPHDDHAMYFWDHGYDPEHLDLSPNELMRWTAMRRGIATGLRVFRSGGAPQPSRFTQKFGGALKPYVVYEKTYSSSYARLARVLRVLRGARARWTDYRRRGSERELRASTTGRGASPGATSARRVARRPR
jgi:hypothetical protein